MPEYEEFPRMVYGPNGEQTIIHSEDERPEGHLNHPSDHDNPDKAKADAAKDEAKAAKAAAKEADKKLREEYKAELDAHGVDYAPNLATPKLGELVKELHAYLAQKKAAAPQMTEQQPNDPGE